MENGKMDSISSIQNPLPWRSLQKLFPRTQNKLQKRHYFLFSVKCPSGFMHLPSKWEKKRLFSLNSHVPPPEGPVSTRRQAQELGPFCQRCATASKNIPHRSLRFQFIPCPPKSSNFLCTRKLQSHIYFPLLCTFFFFFNMTIWAMTNNSFFKM